MGRKRQKKKKKKTGRCRQDGNKRSSVRAAGLHENASLPRMLIFRQGRDPAHPEVSPYCRLVGKKRRIAVEPAHVVSVDHPCERVQMALQYLGSFFRNVRRGGYHLVPASPCPGVDGLRTVTFPGDGHSRGIQDSHPVHEAVPGTDSVKRSVCGPGGDVRQEQHPAG